MKSAETANFVTAILLTKPIVFVGCSVFSNYVVPFGNLQTTINLASDIKC